MARRERATNAAEIAAAGEQTEDEQRDQRVPHGPGARAGGGCRGGGGGRHRMAGGGGEPGHDVECGGRERIAAARGDARRRQGRRVDGAALRRQSEPGRHHDEYRAVDDAAELGGEKPGVGLGAVEQDGHDPEVAPRGDQGDLHRVAGPVGGGTERKQPPLKRRGHPAVGDEHVLAEEHVARRVAVRASDFGRQGPGPRRRRAARDRQHDGAQRDERASRRHRRSRGPGRSGGLRVSASGRPPRRSRHRRRSESRAI